MDGVTVRPAAICRRDGAQGVACRRADEPAEIDMDGMTASPAAICRRVGAQGARMNQRRSSWTARRRALPRSVGVLACG